MNEKIIVFNPETLITFLECKSKAAVDTTMNNILRLITHSIITYNNTTGSFTLPCFETVSGKQETIRYRVINPETDLYRVIFCEPKKKNITNETAKRYLLSLYRNELDESRATLAFERLCELGYDVEKSNPLTLNLFPHTNNICELQCYINILEKKIKQIFRNGD